MVYLKTLIGAALFTAATAEFGDPIVGGVAADASDYPWMVSLQSSGRHFCGGSLIRDDVVLTAAHCMGRSFTVAVKGSGTTLASGEFKSSVKKVYSHESYSGSRQTNDIAIVHLNSKVPASVATPIPIDTSTASTTAHQGASVTVIGWGRLSEGGSTPSSLQEVTVQGFSNAQCAQGYPNQITADMFCAGVSGGGKDSCQGDSGGPLYRVVNGVETQVGVVSWGQGCARAGKLGVYARVAYQQNWIKAKLDEIDGSTGGGGGECQDDPLGWYDSDGATYNCAWYAQGNNCARYGNSYANQGKTANQACCVCGGGTTAAAVSAVAKTDTADCACDGGSGPYDVCKTDIPGIGEKGACIISFGGGFDSTPKCRANANQELKFSYNYQRWYVEGCTPSPKLLVDPVTNTNSVPLVGGIPNTDNNGDDTNLGTEAPADNTVLIVGASVGLIGAALVVGMIVTVRSRKDNDDFSEFKVDQPKV